MTLNAHDRMLGNGGKGLRIHDLVKAPANTPWAVAKQQSWDASEPATVYSTPEVRWDGEPCSAVTVILRTKGCHWWWSSGCTFCGYFNDTRDDVTSEDLHAQWQQALDRFDGFEGHDMVKVYTSGSLLEDREIPVDFQATVLGDCARLGKELVVESRCEQLTKSKLAWATGINPNFTVAIGLEAYDDEVLRFHVNKGFTTSSWERAVDNLNAFGLRVKTYLMFKPPFMSEADALDHCVRWIDAVADRSDEISVNPMNIQRGTIIDRLHRHQEYRPPWLWSLVAMIRSSHALIHAKGAARTRLIVHPTAGGKIRGSHNCGACDAEVVAAIERYAVSADLMEFEGLSCDCERTWQAELQRDRSLPVPLGTSKPRRGAALDILRAP